MTTIVAVRHGETTWNRERRLQGWAPTPLTETGHEQARSVARELAREYAIDRIVASDLHRTKQTTETILEHTDVPVTYDAAWREHDTGVFQGLLHDEMWSRFPEYGLGESGVKAADKTFESGESLNEMQARVLDGWETLLRESSPDETVVVVSHGGPIRLVLGHLKDLPIDEAILDQQQGNCAITEFDYDHAIDATRIVRENATGHV